MSGNVSHFVSHFSNDASVYIVTESDSNVSHSRSNVSRNLSHRMSQSDEPKCDRGVGLYKPLRHMSHRARIGR